MGHICPIGRSGVNIVDEWNMNNVVNVWNVNNLEIVWNVID